MVLIRIKTRTPDSVRKAVSDILSKMDSDKMTNFDTMVSQSVNLNAKNTKNKNSQDLALLQVCDLAKMYGVRVELA